MNEVRLWMCECSQLESTQQWFSALFIFVDIKKKQTWSHHSNVSGFCFTETTWHNLSKIHSAETFSLTFDTVWRFNFRFTENIFFFTICMFAFINYVRTEIQICFYIHLSLKHIPNKIKMRFFVSVSWRKVSHDLPLVVFIIFRAIHSRQKK